MPKRKPMADAAFVMPPFNAQIAMFYDLDEMVHYHEQVLGIHNHSMGAKAAEAMCSAHTDAKGVCWFSLFIPEGTNISTIIHECSHAVDLVLDHHGVPLDVENTEIRAYALQRLFEDVVAFHGMDVDKHVVQKSPGSKGKSRKRSKK